MTVPDMTFMVEVAFGSTWRTPSAERSWVDISEYIEFDAGISTRYGRQDERGQADPNELSSLTIDNSDGAFTVDNPASPYYPHVKVGVPIRITAVIDGYESVRLDALVNEWPTSWPGATESFATSSITASSRLSRIGLQAPAIVDALDAEILATEPSHYFPLTEPAGTTAGMDVVGAAPPLQGSRGWTLGAGGARLADAAQRFNVDGRTAAGVDKVSIYSTEIVRARTVLPTPITFGPGVPGGVSIGLYVRTLASNPSSGGEWLALRDTRRAHLVSGVPALSLFPFAAQSQYSTAGANATVFLPIDIAGPDADNDSHHIGLSVDCDGTTVVAKAYVDGQLVGTTSSSTSISAYRLDLLELTDEMRVRYLAGRVAVWDRALSDDEWADVGGLVVGYPGDTPSERVLRAARWARVDEADVDVPASTVALSGFAQGADITSILRGAEAAEGGVLHDSRDGVLTLRARTERYLLEPAVTIDFETQRIKPDFSPRVDLSALVNVAQVRSPSSEIDLLVTNEDSRIEYGDALSSLDTAAADVDEAYALASWLVSTYGEPHSRAGSVTIDLVHWIGDDALPDLLALDIGSKIRLANAPLQTAALDLDFFVEGYSESMAPGSWLVTFNLSPTTAWDRVLRLDSATVGRLDDNTLAL